MHQKAWKESRKRTIVSAIAWDLWEHSLGLVCWAVSLHEACLRRCNVTAVETLRCRPCPWWWTHPLQSPLCLLPSWCTQTHMRAENILQPPHHYRQSRRLCLPQPLQRSATYIWCLKVQGLGLAQATRPWAHSTECSCSTWPAPILGDSGSFFIEMHAVRFVVHLKKDCTRMQIFTRLSKMIKNKLLTSYVTTSFLLLRQLCAE